MPQMVCLAMQLVWGCLQTLAGTVVRVAVGWPAARRFRGSWVVEWGHAGGLSLGAYLFVPAGCPRALVVHEYGHAVQSLLLGPLYLPVIVLPSLAWAGIPACGRRWRDGTVSYYSFWPERWANRLGERACGEPAPDW